MIPFHSKRFTLKIRWFKILKWMLGFNIGSWCLFFYLYNKAIIQFGCFRRGILSSSHFSCYEQKTPTCCFYNLQSPEWQTAPNQGLLTIVPFLKIILTQYIIMILLKSTLKIQWVVRTKEFHPSHQITLKISLANKIFPSLSKAFGFSKVNQAPKLLPFW